MSRLLPVAVVAAASIVPYCPRSQIDPTAPPVVSEGITRIPAGRAPSALAAADINADGSADLLVGNETSGELTVLLGDGRGGFRPSAGSPFPAGPNPLDIAVGDFNRDGHQDLAAANHETSLVSVLLGNGSGAFTAALGSPIFTGSRPHVHSVAAGDLSGNGTVDLVVESADTDTVQVLYGDGTGRFSSPAPFFVGDLPYFRVRIGDVDGDGRPDVVIALSRENSVAVLRSDGRGELAPAPGSPYAAGGSNPLNVAIGDLNGDRRSDLAVLHSAGISLLLNDGLLFRPANRSPFSAASAPSNLALGDLNGDGSSDVVVSNITSNNLTLLLSAGSTAAATIRTLAVGRHPQEVVIDDFDHDGRMDVAVADSLDDDVAIWLNR